MITFGNDYFKQQCMAYYNHCLVTHKQINPINIA